MTKERNYRILLSPEPDNGKIVWAAEIPELEGCLSYGETPEEALENIRDAREQWIAAALEAGWELPEESHEVAEYSGKFTIRIPKSLHRRLANIAYLEGVSLNQYVLHLLSGGAPNHASFSGLTRVRQIERTSETIKEQWETLGQRERGLHPLPELQPHLQDAPLRRMLERSAGPRGGRA